MSRTSWEAREVGFKMWRAIVDWGVPPEHVIHKVDDASALRKIRTTFRHWKEKEKNQVLRARADGVKLRYEEKLKRVIVYRGESSRERKTRNEYMETQVKRQLKIL